MGILSNNMVSQIQSALNRTSLSQQLISQNIANVDTPNYKAKHLSFSDQLNQSLKAMRTDPRHLPFTTSDRTARIVEDQSSTMQNNGNNVDIDKEMSDLAKSQIQYQTLVQLINSQFSDIKTVIKGGN